MSETTDRWVANPAPQAERWVAPSSGRAERWVVSWAATPQAAVADDLPPAPFRRPDLAFCDTTLRQTVRQTVAGRQLRLRLCNVFGDTPLSVAAACVALPRDGLAGVSAVRPGTSRRLTFSGRPAAVVPPGAQLVSDPVAFAAQAGANLTVSLYLDRGQPPDGVTSHPGSRTTSHLLAGDHSPDTDLPGAAAVDHWYFLSAVEVRAAAAALVTLGDSLTDGRGSTTNGNDRWPDRLLERLCRDPATAGVAVANQATGGNRVLDHGLGPSALSRLDRDVLAQSGVRWLVVFEGVNDIGTAGADEAAQRSVTDGLITAYDQIVTRAHAAGIRVYGATLTPFGANDGYDDPSGTREATRGRVNTWIRTSGRFDAVIDFDRAVRDPADPRRLLRCFDEGDHLHLSPTGYQALADAVPLTLFR